jgi:hypothetical protein
MKRIKIGHAIQSEPDDFSIEDCRATDPRGGLFDRSPKGDENVESSKHYVRLVVDRL